MGSILEGFNWILSKIRYVPCDVLAEPMWPVFSGMIKLRSLPILSQKKLQNSATRLRFVYFFVYIFDLPVWIFLLIEQLGFLFVGLTKNVF